MFLSAVVHRQLWFALLPHCVLLSFRYPARHAAPVFSSALLHSGRCNCSPTKLTERPPPGGQTRSGISVPDTSTPIRLKTIRRVPYAPRPFLFYRFCR